MKKNENESTDKIKENELKKITESTEGIKQEEVSEKPEIKEGEEELDSEKETSDSLSDSKEEVSVETENKKENDSQVEKEVDKRGPKLEIVTPLRREEISKRYNSENIDSNFQQFPKLEAFENKEVKEKELEDELKKVNAMFDNNQGYDDVVKKSIEEIFKSKPMDLKRKQEIEKSIRENVRHLENVLKEFGVEAKVVNYEYGPTITRYEIVIPKGVKVSKVTGLSDDIAMNLAAESIRIEAPIPGKNTIGIETPNKIKEPVHFSNIIKNKELDKGVLRVILGKDCV